MLHFGLLPYVIYNYMWIAYYLQVPALSPYAYYVIHKIIENVKTIFKIKNNRKEIIDNSIETLLFVVLIACIASFVYLSIQEGWNVYSNPL